MQFKVPQFLEIEDKIFGPFTFRQFAYLIGGAGMAFVFYKALGLVWGFIPIIIIVALALTLTFYKPNNKPFINMLEAMLKYGTQSKLYVWKRRVISNKEHAQEEKLSREQAESIDRAVRLSGSKLRDLAWSLDVLDLKQQAAKEQ